MQNRFFSFLLAVTKLRSAGLITAAATLAAMLVLGGCSQYYYQPPALAVTITQPAPVLGSPLSIPLATTDANGNIIATQIQCKAVLQNLQSGQSSNITWAIQDPDPNDGNNYLKACPQNPPAGSTCATLGTITPSTGIYTAPTLLPNFNTIELMAIPAAAPASFAISPLQLKYPTANISSVSPSFLTAGAQYTLDIQGQFFYPATTVTVSGAQTGTVTDVNPNQTMPFGELQAPVQVTLPGLLVVKANNTPSTNFSGARSGTPALVIGEPSSPAAASTIAVQIEQIGTTPDPNNPGSTLPVYANTAFVPLTALNELAVVNADSGTTLQTTTGQTVTISLPSGFAPTAAAANPANHTVAVVSATTPELAVVDATQDTVIHTYPIPASGSVKLDDGSCTVCAIVVDSIRNLAVLDTASGYMTMDLSSGKTSAAMSAPAAEDFAYDPNTQNVYIPYANSNGSGMDVLNLANGSLASYAPASGSNGVGAQPDSTAFDPATDIALTADEASSNYTLTNFNLASASNGQITAPSLSFAITASCSGAWENSSLEFSSHLAWLANAGECVAVAQLPASPVSGSLASPTTVSPGTDKAMGMRWANLGIGPDGIVWNTAPHSLSTFIGMNGHSYALALRADQTMLVKVDLQQLLAAPAAPSPQDANQVDPTAEVNNVPIVNYIPLP